MESTEIATMTSRGQLVIPQGIRQAMSLDEGVKFLVVGEGDTIVLKKLEMPSTNELKALLVRSRQTAKKSKFKKSNLNKLIGQERKKY